MESTYETVGRMSRNGGELRAPGDRSAANGRCGDQMVERNDHRRKKREKVHRRFAGDIMIEVRSSLIFVDHNL